MDINITNHLLNLWLAYIWNTLCKLGLNYKCTVTERPNKKSSINFIINILLKSIPSKIIIFRNQHISTDWKLHLNYSSSFWSCLSSFHIIFSALKPTTFLLLNLILILITSIYWLVITFHSLSSLETSCLSYPV